MMIMGENTRIAHGTVTNSRRSPNVASCAVFYRHSSRRVGIVRKRDGIEVLIWSRLAESASSKRYRNMGISHENSWV